MKNKQKIAIQGIQGCFHQQAAFNYFKSELDFVECLSFRNLCEELKKGTADFAVMAIENTIAGSILQNYALLQEYRFFVCGEIYLPIKMNLLALPGSRLQEINTVSSHHMALKQCEQFLQELDNIATVEMEDTALAAKQIQELQLVGHAAIANELSAKLYDLKILAEGIETNKANFTRFLILSRIEIPNAKANKSSLFLQLKHETGSLVDILNVFKQNQLNLTKIQSIPILGKPYEYSFHIDMEWNNKTHFERTLNEIDNQVQHLSVLGIYEKSS